METIIASLVRCPDALVCTFVAEPKPSGWEPVSHDTMHATIYTTGLHIRVDRFPLS
jgi:hypothetical protein